MSSPTPLPANYDPYLWEIANKRVAFKQHLWGYLFVNGLAWLTYLVLAFTSSRPGMRFPWPLFMSLGWGFGLLSHYLSVYRINSANDPVEREYQKLTQKK